MQKSGLFSRLLSALFDSSLDLRIQTFNLLMIIGVGAGLVMAFAATERGAGAVFVIIANLSLSVLALVMLLVAEKKKCYALCSWIVVIAVFMIMFPLLFIYGGGHKGGMLCFFIVAVVYTSYLLEDIQRAVALGLELIIFISCVLLSLLAPEMITAFPLELDYGFDVLVCFTVSCVMLIIVSYLRARLIQGRQTQIQELNRELIARNETLARYDVMKSDFLATVAHEVNTPLAVIAASSADTLDLLRETPPDMIEIMENQLLIGRRVKLIDSILLDLMDTVAIENGRIPLSRQPADLSELIVAASDALLKKTDDNHNNRIAYELRPDLPLIWVDPPRIEQVMTNLLSNAIRHTTGGLISITLDRAGGSQVVSVSDNGEGMDEQTAQAALRQYVSTKSDYWRHGMGLYICRRIIIAHGGDISIESEKGRGTIVTFTLKEDPIDE